MKYIKPFESMTKIEVKKICKAYDIRNWTLNLDGTVDVDGDVYLSGQRLSKLPLKFGRVTGYFDCSVNKLTSLEGCPTEIGGGFFCDNNQLTSLVGCPKEIGGDFVCSHNKLTSLEGCPTEIRGDFYCNNNQLTSLEGCPTEIGGNFYCSYNQLTSLKGAPEYIEEKVNFTANKNLPEYIKRIVGLNYYYRHAIQKYILKWQKDYSIWRKDGSFNQERFILMMQDAGDELKNLKFPE
jgi:hypothetical protein